MTETSSTPILAVKGRFIWRTFEACAVNDYESALRAIDRGDMLSEVRADNLLTTNGLATLGYALTYAFVQNQNTGWGGPVSTATVNSVSFTAGNLGNIYGAVGTSTTVASASQTSLGAETARVLVTNAAWASNLITLDFFYPQSVANAALIEMGCFAAASTVAGSGLMLDRSVLGSAVTKTNQQVALQELQLTLSSG